MKKVDWLCCQFGSREYYAVPRSLIANGISIGLITDIWYEPESFFGFLVPGLKKRYHPDLSASKVKSFNNYFLAKHIGRKLRRDRTLEFDQTYEKKAAYWIESSIEKITPRVIFSYSYTGMEIFKAAGNFGIKTVSGQINPGPRESEIVINAFSEEFGESYKPTVPNQAYWDRWFKETELADYIVVNSQWSKKLIVEAGIPGNKIKIIPLAYEKPDGSELKKKFPNKFTRENPLKLLYLGSISLRKGFHFLKKAMKKLTGEPVMLEVAGDLIGPEDLIMNLPPNVVIHGRRDGEAKDKLFRDSDVFILPTLSDGFAITQLEAQYWKLPLIVTNRCGEVARNGFNGIVLVDINPDTIKDSIMSILDQPEILKKYSNNASNLEDYSLKRIGKRWLEAVH